MKIVYGLKNLENPVKDSVLTVGVFDGVHLGHKKIINKVVARARALKMRSIVVTFDPHPLKALGSTPKIPSLISLAHRLRLIGQLGVDLLVVIHFTRPVSRMSPKKFVKNILVERLSLKEIYVGENFYFGKGGGAGVEVLKDLAREFGFRVGVVRPVKIKGSVVSSSLIRESIIEGRLNEASKFLGRPASILGTVVSGSRLARALGYPTANINPHHEAIPPAGVYAVRVRFGRRFLKGVLNIGVRPTFYSPRDREPTIEVHIFDFYKKIYGMDLEIIFVSKLRDEIKFKDRYSLIHQIMRDEAAARKILR